MTDNSKLPIVEKLRDARRAFTGTAEAREAADTIEQLYGNAEFLCARLRDLEGFDGDELLRQLMGHVLPALARMETALAKVRGDQ